MDHSLCFYFNEPHLIELKIFQVTKIYRNSLIAKTIFEDFAVFCCCIFVTKYAEFYFINIQK